MPDVSLPWGRLHYEAAGTGDPVLPISGLNGLAAPWRTVAASLARRFRVITHDHRGLGASDRWAGAWSVDQIAADVIGLMDRLGLEQAHLVGHSLGGAVVQAIAADYPNRVDRLVIFASWPGQDPYFEQVMTARREVLAGLGVETFLRSGPLGIYPPRWIRDNHVALQAGLPAALAGFVGVDAMLQRIDACLAHERRTSLPRIAAPTLVLGLDDDASTPSHCSEELAALIPGAKLQLLPYGGHNAHVVVPGEVAAYIDRFLSV